MTDPKAKAREAAHNALVHKLSAARNSFECINAALDAYEAALSAPDGATRLVRIAVAGTKDGDVCSLPLTMDPKQDRHTWDLMSDDFDADVRLAIVTARIPVREVPVVAGDVEEAG